MIARAQLPDSVRIAVDIIMHTESGPLIIDQVAAMQRETDPYQLQARAMGFIGLLGHALWVRHLDATGYGILSAYVEDLCSQS